MSTSLNLDIVVEAEVFVPVSPEKRDGPLVSKVFELHQNIRPPFEVFEIIVIMRDRRVFVLKALRLRTFRRQLHELIQQGEVLFICAAILPQPKIQM